MAAELWPRFHICDGNKRREWTSLLHSDRRIRIMRHHTAGLFILYVLLASASACLEDQDCTSDQVCVQSNCSEKREHGQSCQFDEQCQARMGRSACCADMECTCQPGFHWVRSSAMCDGVLHPHKWYLFGSLAAIFAIAAAFSIIKCRKESILKSERRRLKVSGVNYHTSSQRPIVGDKGLFPGDNVPPQTASVVSMIQRTPTHYAPFTS